MESEPALSGAGAKYAVGGEVVDQPPNMQNPSSDLETEGQDDTGDEAVANTGNESPLVKPVEGEGGTSPEDEDGEDAMFSRAVDFWELSDELHEALDDQFERYDIDESLYIDTEAELNLLATNVAYLALSEPFNLNVRPRAQSLLVRL